MAKLTDADVMTGFNPDRSKTAEDIEKEARESGDEGAVEVAETEGEESDEGSDEGTETPEATPAAEAEVLLDGRRYKTPKEVADAFTREINRRDGTRGAELQTLRERLARLEGAATKPAAEVKPDAPAEPQVPDPELQIENPAEYQKQMLAFIEHSQQKRLSAVATQYEEAEAAREQEAARRAAWAAHCEAFYADPDNEVLRENKDIVDLMLEKHAEELAPLSVEDGFKRLAELSKERLGKVTGVAPKLRARASRPPVLEGSARRDAALTPPAKDEGPRSLTQALKERRRIAAEAFQRGQSEMIATQRLRAGRAA